MPFLLHDSQLTREQRAAVELRPDRNHLIIGPPGSGKTQVLLHRANWLRQRMKSGPDRFRIFVYTNVLKQFIQQSVDYLNIPQDNVQTFDHWCGELWNHYVKGGKPRLPAPAKGTDYLAVRKRLAEVLIKSPPSEPLLDFVMVDEGQDLDANAYVILKATVKHVSAVADARQQIFEGGVSDAELMGGLGITQQTAALLPAYRSSPDIAKLASYFGSGFQGLNYTAKDRQKPCFYVAADWDDEVDQMARIIQERMRLNQKVCVIVPTNRDVFGLASRLTERGVPIEKAIPARKGGEPADFESLIPKIASYHSVKGLTFDCVVLPRLVETNFRRVTAPRRSRLLLVGITRATQWAFLSSVRGYEMEQVQALHKAVAAGDLYELQSEKVASTSVPANDVESDEDAFL